ncbi:ABC-three component system middle component 5 [Lentilitoribacter sp. Alg239-R112]|uniref:ABC-three component system middle component 5 n=1 Tax=Lentilitoribacter sp. Alg239-R112 TaxID=2305987 RepID=UPI001AEE46D5|nr:ABC-three component system middle component 5 [Lentilitoribacter sp. Alg239-R112]
MYSLTYTAAYDPYHTVFRMLGLVFNMQRDKEINIETLRIADFFHCFPWLLKEMSAYTKIPEFLKHKNMVVRLNPRPKFGKLPDSRIMFERMFASQLAAKNLLEINGIFESNDDILIYNSLDSIGVELTQRVESYATENSELLKFISSKLMLVPLQGPGGLKDRSGLSEFRYDNV